MLTGPQHAKFTLSSQSKNDVLTSNPQPSCEEERDVEPIFVSQHIDLERLVDSAENDALQLSNVAEDLGMHAYGMYTRKDPVSVIHQAQEDQLSTKNPYQSRANKKRAEKRREKRKDHPVSNSEARRDREAILPAAAIHTGFDAGKLDASRGAYAGNRGGKRVLGSQADVEKEYDLPELLEMGFHHEKWDGYTAKPIVVNDDLIVGVLAGQPRQPSYKQDIDGIHDLLIKKGKEHGLQTRGEEEDNKRGDFPARRRGYTMGMGSSHPVVLDSGVQTNKLLTELVQDQRLIRLNGYQNGAFEIWAERIKARYDDAVSTMHENITKEDSERGRNFKKSAFTTIAFNFGGKVRCWKHRDQQNLPLGWCAITALGRFKPTRSARLILWELKLVIDFPPGSTILIPSAVITHSNTRIAEGDERTSVTQYTAGAIFRWVDAGCKTDKALKAHNADAWKEHEQKKGAPVSARLGIFSRVNEILSRAAN
ncbi:hypothetical protein VNI00_013019 [Paramarasmius palmivorus]|uniref:Uncharacterized protein n=1 Tax=Paramarasmius palmivorus TaxID=297713 RepID=A0AAW0C1F4_9AGAR